MKLQCKGTSSSERLSTPRPQPMTVERQQESGTFSPSSVVDQNVKGIKHCQTKRCEQEKLMKNIDIYDSLSDVGEIRVYQRADFQSGSRVLKKVF